MIENPSNLAPDTFGGTDACHTLVKLLNDKYIFPHRTTVRNILSFINNCTYNFKWISTIEDATVRGNAMRLMKESIFSKIDRKDIPVIIKSYMKNVINHHCRRYLDDPYKRDSPMAFDIVDLVQSGPRYRDARGLPIEAYGAPAKTVEAESISRCDKALSDLAKRFPEEYDAYIEDLLDD